MAKAQPAVHPGAQPDVPRARDVSGTPDAPSSHSEDGPVHGSVAHHMEELANAIKALGPLNFLPDTWPPGADHRIIDEATKIVKRLIPSRT